MPTSGLATRPQTLAAAAMSRPELGALEGHLLDRLVGARPRVGDGRSGARDRQDPAAVRDQAPVVHRGAAVEDERTGRLGGLDAGDLGARVVAALRIVGRGDDDGDGRLVAHCDAGSGEVAVGGRSQNREQVAVEPRHQNLGLGVAEARVELEHARAVLGEHQPGEEAADERRAPPGELSEHGLDRPVRRERAGSEAMAREHRRPCRRCSGRGRRRRSA